MYEHSLTLCIFPSLTPISLCVLSYAAFNVFFMLYFTSLWILFRSSWAVEHVKLFFSVAM